MMRARKLPLARRSELVTRQLAGELLVYDLKRHKAFCLNNTAATVWKKCNGKRTIADLTAELERHHPEAIDERVVGLALDQLGSANLLIIDGRISAAQPLTRRGLIRAGVIATALPLVTMIIAPTPQAAATTVLAKDCSKRKPSDPGGCGGQPCDVGGNCVVPARATKCTCA